MSTLNIETQGLNLIKNLLKHKDFDYKNPNKLRSVLTTFQRENVLLFHANDSSGYKFVSEQVAIIDKSNPQIAARIVTPMTNISKFNQNTKKRIKRYLQLILNSNPSNDVFEVVSKALNQ